MSLGIIVAVGAIVIGGTMAWFHDTETSKNNTFTAGSIDLKVDSKCHYYVMDDLGDYVDRGCSYVDDAGNTVLFGDWAETDLKDGVHKFFAFEDVKPGDWGENTISLHVYDNDAWGKMIITAKTDFGDTCKEPETEMDASKDADCSGLTPETAEADGELRENTTFSLWLDQGSIAGFQNGGICAPDLYEGDNIWQPEWEPLLSGVFPMEYSGTEAQAMVWDKDNTDGFDGQSDGIIEIDAAYNPEVHGLWNALSAAYSYYGCSAYNADGHNDYNICHGLAADGRMVGSATYYFGVAWQIPYATGNEAQSDGFTGDLEFGVVQHRNNPNQDF